MDEDHNCKEVLGTLEDQQLQRRPCKMASRGINGGLHALILSCDGKSQQCKHPNYTKSGNGNLKIYFGGKHFGSRSEMINDVTFIQWITVSIKTSSTSEAHEIKRPTND